MFEPAFYSGVFPELVKTECRRQAGKVPVVEFKLGDGTKLDVCHLAQLADKWFAVAHFRDIETCDDMDMAFLPYELVVRVDLSFHPPEARRLGFRVSGPVEEAEAGTTNLDAERRSQ